MTGGRNILALIPARGGSKGIPRKNIRLLCGKPLISYSIIEALKSEKINKVVVSTEDEEIARVSRKCGSEIIRRPEELATDTSDSDEVITHAITVLMEGHYAPEVLVLLQPTSPLRSAKEIDAAIDIFLSHDCDSVVSVSETPHSPYWSFILEKRVLKPLFDEKYFHTRRQDLPLTYIPNGAIYVSTPEKFVKNKGFYGKKIIPLIMSSMTSVDIDNEFDFLMAETVLNNRN
jgi:CMP-N,N'-diacetyllegionaminic acid synthase